MEQDIRIRFGIKSLEEQKFELSSSIPESLDGDKLEVRYLIETEILRSQEKVKVTTGVKYSMEDQSLCELIVSAVFGVEPFSDIIVIDDKKKTVSFTKEVIPTLLNITFGTLRGALFEKTKDSPLVVFPLPPISIPELVEMNRFRIENDA